MNLYSSVNIGMKSQKKFLIQKLIIADGNPCEMDLSVGVGEYGLKRFYYDKSSRRCREFMYLGIKGNANNFRNIEECELVCPGSGSVSTDSFCRIRADLSRLTRFKSVKRR